jgi:2-methylcitrate dehydratase
MTKAESLAGFVIGSMYNHISAGARVSLKMRVLDALGCAIGALGAPMIARVRKVVDALGGRPVATLIGGAKSAPDRAAFFNGALVRYLDFNDSYLAKHETCHPSDNLSAVLATSEVAGTTGEQFLTALAVAYEVQCRLSDIAPVRAKGFDHTTQGAYAVAAGISKALGLTAEETSNTIAMSGTANNALRVTRTGHISNWKALAYPNTAFNATHAAYLAKEGITGPIEVFEGNKGFQDAIAGPFSVDWDNPSLEAVERTIIKKYNAEIHSQSAVEAILELRERQRFSPNQIAQIEVEIFDVAYNIIGGGAEGDKYDVHTKEQADHSLPYILSVAVLDGTVGLNQYTPARIHREDVQNLLRHVRIHPKESFSDKFPDRMPVRIQIKLKNGERFEIEKDEYEGFYTRPLSWERLVEKFERLTENYADKGLRAAIIKAIEDLDGLYISELSILLARAGLRRAA